jgi:uncharacterized integral membrane protein (TIGR00697 family)
MNKLFGKIGLFVWIAIATMLANIEVCKSIELFGITGVSLGNVTFGSIFLATDILNENYGYKESKKGVYIGLTCSIIFLLITQLDLLFVPSSLDVAHSSMAGLFAFSPRVTLASVSLFFIASLLDVWLFQKLKQKTKGKHLGLRNNVSTIVANCSENFIFYIIGFLGIYSFKECLIFGLTASIIEIAVGLLDTPFMYLSKKFKKKEEI